MREIVDVMIFNHSINVVGCDKPIIIQKHDSGSDSDCLIVDEMMWCMNLWDIGIRSNNILYLSWQTGNFMIFNLFKHYKVTTIIFYISC